MTLFWTGSAVMLLLGLAWVVPPLLRPARHRVSEREQQNIEIARERLRALDKELAAGEIDPDQFEQERLEVEQILASDLSVNADLSGPVVEGISGLRSAIGVALLIPFLSILLYSFLGNPQALTLKPGGAGSAADGPGQMPSVQEMVRRLADRLEREPNDPRGWRLLARSFSVMQRYPEAVDALRRARGLLGDDPSLLIELADAIAAVQNGSFEGEPDRLIAGVLAEAPQNPGALWLAGRSALVARDFPTVLKYWRTLESVLPPQSEGLESVRLAISKVEEVRANLAVSPKALTDARADAAESKRASPSDTGLRVKVALDPSLESTVDPDDAVFIYAQALNGPPMPLAVTRKKVRDLPVQVVLTDSMAMMPAMALSKFPEVRVVARVSKTGNAIPQSGDFKGQIEPVSVTKSSPVEILITEKIP